MSHGTHTAGKSFAQRWLRHRRATAIGGGGKANTRRRTAVLCTSRDRFYRRIFFLTLLTASTLLAEPFVDRSMLGELTNNYGERAHRRGVALNALVERLRDTDTATQLVEVNAFFNQFIYATDPDTWGEEDYWATPVEFLGRQTGDCEDFVIAKYFVLRALGISDESLYLTYVKALKQNIAHMVLTYHEAPGSVPLVLDNYNAKILPASERPDLAPVYSFNADSLFLSNASAGLGQVVPTEKLKNSKWTKLLSKLKRTKP